MFKKHLLLLLFTFLTLLTQNAYAALSSWAETEQGRVRLLASDSNHGGIEFQLKDGWKTYWRTPGDVGMPPSFGWDGSINSNNVTIGWPIPERHSNIGGIEDFIYSGRVILPFTIRLNDESKDTSLTLNLHYLVCKEVCIPLEANLSLMVPASHQDSEAAALIAPFKDRIPKANNSKGLSIDSYRLTPTPKGALLEVKASSQTGWNAADLIIEGREGAHFLKPDIEISGKNAANFTVAITFPATKPLAGSILHLTLINDHKEAVELEIPANFSDDFQTLSGAKTEAAEIPSSLIAILLIAVIGGLILNIMPCVLPVLSIKLLSVIRHGGGDHHHIRASFLASSAGIIFSFLLIACGLIALKSLGYAIGFGFQFQQPVFLVLLVVILVLFACNLWGLFEFHLPTRFSGFALTHMQDADNTVLGHFLTGAFATLLATPCSAPFVGTAISFALGRGPLEILLIFSAMGTGLALPYLLLSFFPSLVSMLPKPGAWMIKLRFILGIALILTAFWLLFVISNQLGLSAALVLFLLCLLLKFAIGTRTGLFRSPIIRGSVIIALIAACFLLPFKTYEINKIQAQMADDVWQVFDEEKITRDVAAGKIVVVDVTADWCLACKINKLTLFNRFDILTLLKQPNVVAMRADLTSPNPQIIAYLKSFKRYAIPFNAVYGPAAPKGIALSEMPSKAELLLAISQAKGSNGGRSE